MQLGNFSRFVFNRFVAVNDIRVFQPHIPVRFQPLIFRRGNQREIASVNVDFFRKRYFSRPQLFFQGVAGRIQHFFAFVVCQHHFQRIQNRHRAFGVLVQIIAYARFQIARGIRLYDARLFAEIQQRLRGNSAVSQPGDRRHARVVPAVHEMFFHKLFQISLAHHRVRDVQPREFNLPRLRVEAQLYAHPVV